MMHIGIIGTILILSLLLWPLIISSISMLFLSSHKRAFFISSLLVGYYAYLTPVFLKHIRALVSLEKETII
jgi:hypothetical protein